MRRPGGTSLRRPATAATSVTRCTRATRSGPRGKPRHPAPVEAPRRFRVAAGQLARMAGHLAREGVEVAAGQALPEQLRGAVVQQGARALEVAVGQVLVADRGLDEALQRLPRPALGP